MDASDVYFNLKANELLHEGGLQEIDNEDSSLDSVCPNDPSELINDVASSVKTWPCLAGLVWPSLSVLRFLGSQPFVRF